MKVIIQDGRRYVLKFEKGELYPEVFVSFLKKERIKGGFFVGLGACAEPEISVYALRKKKYTTKKFRGDFEVLNVTGNVAEKNGKIVLHQHITLSSKNFGTIGGHLEKVIVSGTLEIFLITMSKLERKLDGSTGLNLLR